MLAWAGRGRDVRQRRGSGVFASFILKACGASGGRRGPSFQRREEPLRASGKQAADERREDEPVCGTCLRRIRLTSPSYPPTDFGRRSVELLTASPPHLSPPLPPPLRSSPIRRGRGKKREEEEEEARREERRDARPQRQHIYLRSYR